MGIVPKALTRVNIIEKTNGEELIITCLYKRLIEKIDHANAFIALPGGLGTLEEIFTITS